MQTSNSCSVTMDKTHDQQNAYGSFLVPTWTMKLTTCSEHLHPIPDHQSVCISHSHDTHTTKDVEIRKKKIKNKYDGKNKWKRKGEGGIKKKKKKKKRWLLWFLFTAENRSHMPLFRVSSDHPKAGENCSGKIVMITTKQPTDKEADVSVHHLTPPAGLHCLFHSDGPLN